MAFGQDLKTATKTTRLYRKVSGSNFIKSGEHCFSTDQSVELISRGDFCIVLEKNEYKGQYDNKDADAGKNFGYDEFRVELTQEELIEKIECIVVPNWWEDDIDEDLYDTDKDPMVWIDNLSEFGKIVFEKDFETSVNLNF